MSASGLVGGAVFGRVCPPGSVSGRAVISVLPHARVKMTQHCLLPPHFQLPRLPLNNLSQGESALWSNPHPLYRESQGVGVGAVIFLAADSSCPTRGEAFGVLKSLIWVVL